MTISKELLSGVDRPEDLLGAERTEHWGYEPHVDPDQPAQWGDPQSAEGS